MTLPAPALKRLQSALYRQRPRCVKHDVPYEAIKADALLAKADRNDAGQYLCMTCAGPMSFRAEMVRIKQPWGMFSRCQQARKPLMDISTKITPATYLVTAVWNAGHAIRLTIAT